MRRLSRFFGVVYVPARSRYIRRMRPAPLFIALLIAGCGTSNTSKTAGGSSSGTAGVGSTSSSGGSGGDANSSSANGSGGGGTSSGGGGSSSGSGTGGAAPAACGPDIHCMGTVEVCCDGACTIVLSDAQNCGSCGVVCDPMLYPHPYCDFSVCKDAPCGFVTCQNNQFCCGNGCCSDGSQCCNVMGTPTCVVGDKCPPP